MEKLKSKSNIDKDKTHRKKRKQYYDNTVLAVLSKCWRIFDRPQTPYKRVLASNEVSEEVKQKFTKIYNSLNPAELKRTIDIKLKKLYDTYQEKNKSQKVESTKKQKSATVRLFIAEPKQVLVR